MFTAKIRTYNNENKTISITFNDKQEDVEKWYFSGYEKTRTIVFEDFKNKKQLANQISEYIHDYYKEQSRIYPKNFIEWTMYSTKKTLIRKMETSILLIYDKNLFDDNFNHYIKELKKKENKNENS